MIRAQNQNKSKVRQRVYISNSLWETTFTSGREPRSILYDSRFSGNLLHRPDSQEKRKARKGSEQRMLSRRSLDNWWKQIVLRLLYYRYNCQGKTEPTAESASDFRRPDVHPQRTRTVFQTRCPTLGTIHMYRRLRIPEWCNPRVISDESINLIYCSFKAQTPKSCSVQSRFPKVKSRADNPSFDWGEVSF